jgi:transposase-like protein
MVLAPSVAGLFKWRQFEPEMILLAVGWYLRFSLSSRDVEELLAERGLLVDHVTVWRWVQRYAPEIQRRLRPRLRPTNDSWRVDETYIRVKGKWVYLYRAVDSSGATIDFLLSAKRDAAAAERFLAKALRGENHPAPRVINTDVCGRVCFDAFYRISTNHGFPPDFPVARRICWHSLNDVFPPGVLLRGGRVRRMHGGQQLPR